MQHDPMDQQNTWTVYEAITGQAVASIRRKLNLCCDQFSGMFFCKLN